MAYPQSSKRWYSRGQKASVLVFFCLVGCNQKDPAKCEQATATAKQAAETGDMALAQKWRDYAWKQCEDKAALGQLDQALVQKQQEREAKDREEQAKKQKTAQLLGVFTSWIGQSRAAPERASVSPACDPVPEKTPADKKDERWCKAMRKAGEFSLEAFYWDAERPAVRFTTVAPNPITCADLGAAQVVRAWPVPAAGGATAERSLCQITGGALAGMQAVVTNGANGKVHVFSDKYLEHDAAFKSTLGQ
jgi:hypothetical protein